MAATGKDTLRGDTGADKMIGCLGADILERNGGADKLTGGADNDVFRGTAANLNGDTITDFAAGDMIVISNATLTGFSFALLGNKLTYTGGSLTLTDFTGQLQVSAAAGGGVQLMMEQISAAAISAGDFGDSPDDMLWQHDRGTVTNWLDQTDGEFVASANGDTVIALNWQVPPDLII